MTIKTFAREWGPQGPTFLIVELAKIAMRSELSDEDRALIAGVVQMATDLESILRRVRI